MEKIQITIIGAGAWGTALAKHLGGIGHLIKIWAFEQKTAQIINEKHINPYFLPGFNLPSNILAFHNLKEALYKSKIILIVVPSHVFRQILIQTIPYLSKNCILISCSKGIEANSGFTMCEIAKKILPENLHKNISCLSGPTFAKEVATGTPTAVTIASLSKETAKKIQISFASELFRLYSSTDVTGVEIGGAVKNPLAIAAGICAGLQLGYNSLAALITRGLAEMGRLSKSKGGRLSTIFGLSGLGDLVLTCNSSLSRNRTVGYRLGQGESIENISSSMDIIAEGIINTKTIHTLAKKAKIEMPLIDALFKIIYEKQKPKEILKKLMSRELKPEIE